MDKCGAEHRELLAEAIAAVHADQRAVRTADQEELAVVTGQLAAKHAMVDKYPTDFESATLTHEVLERRVGQLTAEIEQLRHRRDAAAPDPLRRARYPRSAAAVPDH